MGAFLRFLLLTGIKLVAGLFYRFETQWIAPPDPSWDNLRVMALLNHTSLYEWLYAGAAPTGVLWHIAHRAFIPIADKTAARPIVGRFLTSLAPHHQPISREFDHTWTAVLDRVQEDVLVVIAPEGRMMRANGLDRHGCPMTVRGGIADILRTIPDGRMLLVYLGGLHHVQAPGERVTPRLWKTIRATFEPIDIAQYKADLGLSEDPLEFKAAVKADLERRRDLYCPTPDSPAAASPRAATPDRV